MNPQDDDRNDDAPPTDDSQDGSFFLEGLTISPEEAEKSEEPLPEATDEFEFVRELGRGGMGVVYEVIERKSGRRVALKVISKRLELAEDAIKRFEREGRAAASISHDNCVFVYGAHIVHRSPAISMELTDGETMEERLRRQGPPDAETAAQWIIDILDGIAAAHEAGVIHRDIKPSNVFIDESGTIKVGDFGLSRSLDTDQKLTMTGAFLGSPMYASPEQVRGLPLDHRTDIYSIGATLYTVLTGDSPFRAKTVGDLFAQVATETPAAPSVLRPNLPPGLDKVVARAMARSPDKRFQDCEAFRRALERFLPGASSPAGLGYRALAHFIDMTVVVAITVGVIIVRKWLSRDEIPRNISVDGRDFWSTGIGVLYFATLEGFLGTTPGKMLFGLSVTRLDGGKPGLARALIRAVVFKADTIAKAFHNTFDLIRISPWIGIPLTFMPFVSMRPRNGYRGVHEFASATRVIESRPPFARRLSGSSLLDPKRKESAKPLWTRGDLQVLGVIGSTPSGTLVHARDPRLARDVLLHEVAGPDRRLPEAERSRSDARRLRWLDAGEDGAGAWDVYEAPGGAALVEYRQANRGLDWTHARGVLMTLGVLLSRDDPEISVERLWVDRKGRLRVLDFDIVGETPVAGRGRAILAEATRVLFGISENAASALPEDIPEEAEGLIRRIVDSGLPDDALSRLHHDLEGTAVEAHEVPRRLRGVGIALQALGMLIVWSIAFALLLDASTDVERDRWLLLSAAFGGQLALASITAWITRSAPVFKLLRIRVVNRFGRRASRLRCAGRAAAAWLPGLALTGLGWSAFAITGSEFFVDVAFAVICGTVYLGGVVFSIVDPERSVQDRIAGTRLVH